MVETFKIPQGEITVLHSDQESSIGLLYLAPGESLDKHNRTVEEELFQIQGQSVYTVFDGDNTKKIILNKGESLILPSGQFHVHGNESREESITFWRFVGDVTDVIQAIRDNFGK
ncbi:cupin domain-containing protein [Candidatus Dojkabacteria bacterium]|nr:cupin domain-containing protein [Candidatus Dojkabacteria bacterium]